MLFKALDRVQLMTLVGFAGFGGIAACTMGYAVHRHQQWMIRKQPFFRQALDVLDANKRACELIGKPIAINNINVLKEGTIYTNESINMFIPLQGKRLKGDLLVKARRLEPGGSWILDRVDFLPDSEEQALAGMHFIIFKGKALVARPTNPQDDQNEDENKATTD